MKDIGILDNIGIQPVCTLPHNAQMVSAGTEMTAFLFQPAVYEQTHFPFKY